jgi:hypothetical protein
LDATVGSFGAKCPLRVNRTHAPQQVTASFDHFVGDVEQVGRHDEAQRLDGLQVNDKLEFGGLQHRKVGWFLAPQSTAGVDADLTMPSWTLAP